MAIDPLANINQSISEVEAAQDPLSAFNRLFSDVNSGFTPNPVPIISAPVPLTTSKAVNINQELVGNEATGPYPGVNDNTQQGNKSFVDSALDYMYDAETWAKDQYKYGRTYSYGAGWKNMQFERFYTHPQYKKLGFSPYRNNEELYNENSTWLDDWRRSSSQYWKLFSNAFGSSMFASDDFKASETMQEGMALGASSKDGVGSSITNFGLSSMYSLGIAAEVLVENIALTAVEAGAVFLAPETAGASLSVAGAAAIKQGASFAKFAKGISNMYEFLKTLKIAENAKSFYDASKIGKAGLAAAKFLNPLGSTADFTRFLAKSEKSWSAVEKLALTAHGFSHFYNDLRGISLAVEESGLEGAMARSEYHQKLIDEYYAKYGTMPEGEAAKDIYQRAASVDFSVSMANLPTIMLSNKIVFNKFLKGFPSMSTIVKSIEKQSGRQLVKTAAGEVLEKGAIELTEKSAGKKAAEFFISSPYVPWSREYIAGNLTEALQENTQDAISTAVMAYHDKIDKDPSVAGFWEGVSQFGTGVQGQFGKQGLETFLSGYFTGSLVGGLQGGVVNAISGIKSRTKSGQAKVQAAKERSRQREDSIKESVNAMAKDAVNIGYHNATTASAVKNYAEEVDNAVDEGNPYKAHTMKDGMFNKHAFNLAQHNKTELFTEHIDDMLQLSDEDLTKAYAMSLNEASDLRKRLNSAKERAQDVQNTYNAISKEFANPVDLSLVDPKKNEALYKKMLYKYAAHQEAIEFITLSIESAKDVNGRILSIVNEFSQASPWLNVRRGTQQVSNAGASDIMILLDSFQRDRAIETLELEADTLKEGTAEQKKKAKEKLAKIELLKKWSEVSNNFNQLRQLKAAAFKAKTQDLTEVTNKINEELVSEMYPLFDEYTKMIAKEQGGMLISKELNQAFNKIRDYYLLDQDYQGYVQSINILNDPLYFDRFINALETAQSQLKEKEAERIAEGFTKFMGYRDIEVYNEFFNKIYDIGLFVIPENVQEFFKNPRTAKYEIFDIASKEPVLPGSNKYEEFQKIIDEYYPATSTGAEPVVEGEIISEEAVGEAITINTDINDMPKELQDELIAAFEDLKEYYKTQRPGDQFPFFNFPQFILRSGKAKQIIDNYNKKNGLVAKPAEAAKKPEPAKTKAPVTPAPVPTGAKAAPEVDNKIVFRILEKAFYEGNDKRYSNITAQQLNSLSPETRAYLLDLYEVLKPFNSKYQRLGKILDPQTNKEILSEDDRIIYVTSNYFGGKSRPSSELGSSTDPKHKDLVFPVPSAKVLQDFNNILGAKINDAELDALKGTQPSAPVSTDTKADNIISNGDRIINVQTKPVTNEITDTNGELFITSDKDPGGRIYINMDPLKDVLVVPNNTLTVIDKKTGNEIINKELNPEGAVIFEAMQGRLFVVANINGQLIPFYKSSAGTSGKTQGEWYPFFGYTGAWLVKGGIDKATGKMSYSPEIDKVTDLLNKNLVFPDKYIDRATNSIKNNKGEEIFDFNKLFKVNRLWQKEFGSQTGKGTNYEIKGLKENTRSESGLVALITGLNTTELDSSKTPKELSEWFNLISKNAELAALKGGTTDVKADIERKKSLSQELINFVWERLAKQGIDNADSIIGIRQTIDGVDFDKFWSNVTKEDLQNLKKLYETQKQEQLDLYNKFKGGFDPSTGTITSNDTSFFDNKIKNVDAELAALESKAPVAEVKPGEFKVGDKVKVNTPKDGEGVIKEDRGDKVLLDDGRQVFKKNLSLIAEETKTRTIRVGVAEEIKPTTVAEVKEALKKLNEKTLQVSEDNSDFYADTENPEDTWKRVTALKSEEKKEFTGDNADRGTVIDGLLRRFIKGQISSIEDMNSAYEDEINKLQVKQGDKYRLREFKPKLLQDLFGIFQEIKAVTDKEGLELISDIPTLWGVLFGKKAAGTIDLLAINKKGEVFIIDLKTSTRNRRDLSDPYYESYRSNDSFQQSAYAELLRQRTGITVKNVVIFPVQVSALKNSWIKAEANKEGDKFTMQVQIDKNLFPEQALSPEASEIQEVLKQEVEEAPEWFISDKEAVRNTILTKLRAIEERIKIERTPDILDEINKLEDLAVKENLPSKYINEISVITGTIKSQFKSISRIQIGDYIIFESNPTAKFEVVDKNENELMLYNQALPMEDRINTEPEIVTKKDMYKVAKIIAGGAPEVIELTEEEKAINRTNTISADEFLANDEAVKEAYNSTKSVEETQKGIFEDLDNCKLQ